MGNLFDALILATHIFESRIILYKVVPVFMKKSFLSPAVVKNTALDDSCRFKPIFESQGS